MSQAANTDFHIAEPPLRPSKSDLWFVSYLPWSLSGGLSTPLIPLLAILLYQGINPLIVALVVAASDFTEIPFTILWGNLSDRWKHRKYFMVASFASAGVVLVAMPFSPNINTYILLNVVEGVCSAASAPIGTMLLLETRNKTWWSRDIGFFDLVSGIGTVAGLALGGLWVYSFYNAGALSLGLIPALKGLLILTGVLGLLSAVMALRWIEEPKEHVVRGEVEDRIHLGKGLVERMRGFRRRVVAILTLVRGEPVPIPLMEWLFLSSLFVVSFGSQMFYGTFVYFLTSPTGAHVGEGPLFLIFFASALASTALYYHSGKATERYSAKHIFIVSMVIRAVVLPLFIMAGYYLAADPVYLVWSIVALNGVMGITWAFASTASVVFLLKLLSGNANRGKALGLYTALSGLGGLVGTVLGGWLYTVTNAFWAYAIASTVVMVGAVIILPIHYRFTPYRHLPQSLKGTHTPSIKKDTGVSPWTTGE